MDSSSPPRLHNSPYYTPWMVSVSIILFSMCFILYYARHLFSFLDSVQELGLLGNLIFIFSYLPTGLPFAFMSYYIPLTLSGGFIYGYFLGFLTVTIGSVSSACFGFWVARHFCRSWVEDRIKSSSRLSSLMPALEVHAFKITLVMRFLPLPFGLQNGLCAMTNITPYMFFIASIIGLLPENSLLLYFGHSFRSIGELASGGFGSFSVFQKAMLVVALAVGIVSAFFGKKVLYALSLKSKNNKKELMDNDNISDHNLENGLLIDLDSQQTAPPLPISMNAKFNNKGK